MPSLSPADRLTYLRPLGISCLVCRTEIVRHYCRSCDTFFHGCTCHPWEGSAHGAHRVYLWTPAGIQAIPDFDTVGPERAR